MKNFYHICTLNARSLLQDSRLIELEEALEKVSYDVIGLNETRKKGNGNFVLNKSKAVLYYSGGVTSANGVGILVHPNLSKNILHFEPISDRICAMDISLTPVDILRVVSIYAPASSNNCDIGDYETFMEEGIQALNRKRLSHLRGATTGTHTGNPQWKRGSRVRVHSMILGDLNAKVGRKELADEESIGNYGYGDRNERGQTLVNMCEAEGLKIMNTFYKKRNNRKWTWLAPNNTTRNCIDFILTKDSTTCQDVDIINNFAYRTDHRLVRARFSLGRQNRRAFKQRIENILDRPLFVAKLHNMNVRNLITQFKSSYTSISGLIQKAANDSKQNLRSIPRFSQNTKDLYRKRKGLLGKLDFTSRMDLINTNKLLRYHINLDLEIRYEEIVKDAIQKRRSLKKTLERTKIWTFNTIQLRKENGELAKTSKETEGVVATFYNKLYSSTVRLPPPLIPNPVGFNHWITEVEVRRTLQKMKKGTAPGDDKITVEMLIAGDFITTPLLTRMFNECLLRGEVPECFGDSVTSLLFKKGEPEDIKNYRPISLLSSIYKLFTRILNNRMEEDLDTAQPVEQAGFRKGYSTLDDIHTLKLLMKNAREYKFPLYLIFVDYEKAFDSVEFPAVWRALLEQGVDPIYVRIIENIYANAQSEIKVNKGRVKIEIERGVRQGDTISPKLFTACVEDIFRRLDWRRFGIDINGIKLTNLRFADDLVLISHEFDEIQGMLEDLRERSLEIGLKINKQKTVAMTNGAPFNLTMDGSALHYVDNFVYLGHLLTMDSGDDREIDRRIKSGWNSLRMFKKFLKNKRVPMKFKRKLFNQCTVPAILYGCETWSLRREDREKLRRAQRRMERMMVGITVLDRWTNERVRGVTKVVDIVEEATKRKWKWARETIMKNDDRWTKKMTNWTPSGWMDNRQRGRPPMRWTDEFKKQCGHNWRILARTNLNRWKLHLTSQQVIV